MSRRGAGQDLGKGFTLAAEGLRRTMIALTTRTWIDADKLPSQGGCIVVLNHVSHIDPLVTGHFLYDQGRVPRYLAKSSLFKNRVLRWLLQAGRQIPVERLTKNAVDAYSAAVAAVEAGDMLAVYPEGTLTRDPDMWPMRGKSGAARIALATRAPVHPIGHWGAQELLPPYSKRLRPMPRTHVTLKVGDLVDLSDLYDLEHTPEVVQEATDRIMAAIVALVEELRGGTAPAVRFDPARAGVAQIGNPNDPKNPQFKKQFKKEDEDR